MTIEPERVGYFKPMSHQQISFAKSFVRIAGYILLPVNLIAAAVILALSEVLGILEEVGER